MGRPKKFDPDIVLDKAMELFHKKGFNATKTDEIVEHLGINKFSIYKEFGSNKELFDRAIFKYYEERFTNNFGSLSTPTSSIKEIQIFFNSLSQRLMKNRNGCMICNTSVEFSGIPDNKIRNMTDDYFKAIPAAFKNALNNANDNGLLISNIDTEVASNLLSSIFLGLTVQARGKVSISLIRSSCDGAIQYLNAVSRESA
jgi:TetR/AcrR family transcriptional repressor of nem operon